MESQEVDVISTHCNFSDAWLSKTLNTYMMGSRNILLPSLAVGSRCYQCLFQFCMINPCLYVLTIFDVLSKSILELLFCRRYYFSLYLELSDIMMPLVRAVIDKVSNAISFFLVTLIGRSLGLIYTGIRQSLRWK